MQIIITITNRKDESKTTPYGIIPPNSSIQIDAAVSNEHEADARVVSLLGLGLIASYVIKAL